MKRAHDSASARERVRSKHSVRVVKITRDEPSHQLWVQRVFARAHFFLAIVWQWKQPKPCPVPGS